MVSWLRWSVCVLCLSMLPLRLLGASPVVPAPPDVSFEKHVTFHVEEAEDGAYRLRSSVAVQMQYLSARSTANQAAVVEEPFYASVENLRGTARGRPLDDEAFSFRYAELNDVFLSGFKLHSLSFPADLEPGDEITYAYDQTYRALAFLPVIEVPNVSRLAAFTVTVEHPADVAVAAELFFPRAAVPYTLEHPSPTQTVLRFEALGEQPALTHFPHNGFQAAALLSLRRGAEALTPTTPEALAAWYHALLKHEMGAAATVPSDTVRAQALALTAEAATDRAKVAALHDFAREHIRYVADEEDLHAIVPRRPAVVLARGYGDCKDKAFLVSAMARALGLDVNMALLSTHPRPSFEGAHVTLFNHVIAVYDDAEGRVYFDPTQRYAAFGDLPESLVGRPALVLDPERPHRDTVRTARAQPLLDVRLTGDVSDPAAMQAEVTLRGRLYAAARQVEAGPPGVERENALAGLTNPLLHKITLERFALLEQTPHALTYTAAADLSRFVIASPTRRYVPHTPFQAVDAALLDRRADAQPVYLPAPLHVRLSMDLAAPGVTATADSAALRGGGAAFDAALRPAPDGRLRLQYDYRQPGGRFDAAARRRFLDFCQAYLESKRNMFILTNADS